MFEIFVHRGGTVDWRGSLYEADGTTPIVLASTDKVRVKIGRGDQVAAPDLDILSGTATSNSSSVTIDTVGVAATTAAQYTLRLAQVDTALLTGPVYEGLVAVVDDSETAPADAFIVVEYFVLHVLPALAGSKGLT